VDIFGSVYLPAVFSLTAHQDTEWSNRCKDCLPQNATTLQGAESRSVRTNALLNHNRRLLLDLGQRCDAFFNQLQKLVAFSPTVQIWMCETAPPSFILIPNSSIRLLLARAIKRSRCFFLTNTPGLGC